MQVALRTELSGTSLSVPKDARDAIPDSKARAVSVEAEAACQRSNYGEFGEVPEGFRLKLVHKLDQRTEPSLLGESKFQTRSMLGESSILNLN